MCSFCELGRHAAAVSWFRAPKGLGLTVRCWPCSKAIVDLDPSRELGTRDELDFPSGGLFPMALRQYRTCTKISNGRESRGIFCPTWNSFWCTNISPILGEARQASYYLVYSFKIEDPAPTLPAYRTSSTVPHPSSNGYVRLRICVDPDASISPPSVAWQLSFNKSSTCTRNQTNEQKHNRFALKQSLTRLHLSLLACSLMIKEHIFLCRKSASRKLMILGHFRYLMPFNYLSYEQS